MAHDFWEELRDVPGEDALLTKGGMKISFSRRELSDYFNILLEKRPLEILAGETAYWVLIPSLVAVYSFPVLLFITKKIGYSLLAALGLMMSMSLFNQSSYNYFINKYLVKPASSNIPKLLINMIFAILLYRNGYSILYALLPFIWYILVDRIPIIYLLSELLMLRVKTWMYNLADPDGVLRQVGWYWAKKHNLEQSETGRVQGKKPDTT